MKPKNTICLWFDKDAVDAARFYAATFPSPHFSQPFVARQSRVAWMRGARRFCDEAIVDTMVRSEIVAQRSRQAAIDCRSRRAVRNAGYQTCCDVSAVDRRFDECLLLFVVAVMGAGCGSGGDRTSDVA